MNGHQSNYPTNTLFQYSGTEKHILLIERHIDQDLTLSQSYLLDQQFSVIMNKKNEIANFEPTRPQQKQEKEKLYYRIQEEEPSYWYQGFYKKYCRLSDFLIGRQHWQRSQNTLKISSNSISRMHTKFAYNKPNLNKQDFALSLRHMIKKQTKTSSKWRKLSLLLLQKIADYVVEAPYYTIQDCNSRNGTYLLDRQIRKTPIRQGEQYQFQRLTYVVKPKQIIRAQGVKISERLDEFEQKWEEPCPRYYYKYEFIFGIGLSRQSIRNSTMQINAIHLQVVINLELKFNFWIICRNINQIYNLGYGQTLNISPSQDVDEHFRYYSISHGHIEFRNGSWWIEPAREDERVWKKIQPNKKYHLDTKKKHSIRVGHITALQLQFKNF